MEQSSSSSALDGDVAAVTAETVPESVANINSLRRPGPGVFEPFRSPSGSSTTSPVSIEKVIGVRSALLDGHVLQSRSGGFGSGPPSVAAAHALGFTTQLPSFAEVAVPGKTPDPFPGVRFRSRPYAGRARELRPLEVAALEVLADPHVMEARLEQLDSPIKELIATGVVRGVLDAARVRRTGAAVPLRAVVAGSH